MHHSGILIITGGSGSGKSTILKNVFQGEIFSEVKPGGILAPGRYLPSGIKEFDLELIPGNEKYFLSSQTHYSGWEAIGNFWFNPPAIQAGLKHLTTLEQNHYHFYVLDEIGPFELEGLLWAQAIPGLLKKEIPMIWTIRYSLIKQVCKKWGLLNQTIVNLGNEDFYSSLFAIEKWIKKNAQD